MAITRGFGQQLREARVSHGLTYGTVSRKLRIRPDIIQAIEEEDFSSLPPRANTRAMIQAYASLLGLNPAVVVESYMQAAMDMNTQQGTRRRYRSPNAKVQPEIEELDYSDSSAHESAQAARQRIQQRRARKMGNPEGESSERRRSRSGQRSSSRAPRETQKNRSAEIIGSAIGAAKNIFTGAAGAVANTVGGIVSSRKRVDINHSIYADRAKQDGFPSSRGHRGNSIYSSSHNIMSSGSYNLAGSQQQTSNLPFVIGVVVVLVVLFVVCNFLFNKPTSTSSTSNVAAASTSSSVAISGLTDPGSAGTVEQQINVVPIAPTAAVFNYEIEDGEEAYVEIYLNGSSTPDVATVLSGPKRGTYDVTDTLTFVTSRPNVVTLKVDGEPVELEDKKGNGIYVYDVDFNDILAAWKEANGQ